MNIALWVVAGLLAFTYLVGGLGKLFVPKEKIAANGASGQWALDFSTRDVKAIGLLEVLGAFGLILPAVFSVASILVPLAALGLAILMVGAVVVRIRRLEYKLAILDVVYLALNLFVVWGRLVIYPIPV